MQIASKSCSMQVTFAAAMILVPSCCIETAAASSFSFPQFNVIAQDMNHIQSVPLSGAPAGTVFNGYTVAFDWTAGNNLPQSHEASFALVNQPPPQNASSVFYADPGAAPNSKFDGNTIRLSWGGLFDTNYTGGNPLNFWYVQSFASSTAFWDTVDVTLYSFPPVLSGFSGNTAGQPTWRRPNTASALSNTGTAVPYQSVPFTVDQSGPYIITTTPTAFDGYLAIYADSFNPTDQLTNILALNDDGPTGGSQVSVALTAGQSYFLVQTGFGNNDFGAWTATFSGTGSALVPEPTTTTTGIALLAAATGFFAVRPRSRQVVRFLKS
jgi:hypothetical protein